VGQSRSADRRLALAMGLSAVLLAVEAVAGYLAHSLALLSDAGHILTDILAFGLAWFAIYQSRRPADPRRTFGYHRVEVLAAMTNGGMLVLIVLAIAVEAARRLVQPQPVQGPVVVGVALVALAANLFLAFVLRHPGMSLNERAALLHVIGDLAASAAVLVAGCVIILTGWVYADPLLSLVIAALVAWSAGKIVLDTLNILLEGTPRGLDVDRLGAEVEALPGVVSIHDVHAWALDSRRLAFSAHLVVAEQTLADAEHLVREVENLICDRFGIAHTTIQVELCHPCEEDVDEHLMHNHPHRAAS
jgi:cobalt-zinc-cadmium efflux system protein